MASPREVVRIPDPIGPERFPRDPDRPARPRRRATRPPGEDEAETRRRLERAAQEGPPIACAGLHFHTPASFRPQAAQPPSFIFGGDISKPTRRITVAAQPGQIVFSLSIPGTFPT
jgi:hypothetical protein